MTLNNHILSTHAGRRAYWKEVMDNKRSDETLTDAVERLREENEDNTFDLKHEG